MEKPEPRPILNITRHNSSESQQEAGVFEPSERNKQRIIALLTFDEAPTPGNKQDRAKRIALVALEECKRQHPEARPAVMMGGAPYFMSTLERTLKSFGIKPLYSFSKREEDENGKLKHEYIVFIE